TDEDSLDFGTWAFPVYNINAALTDTDVIQDLKRRGKGVNLFTVNDPVLVERFIRAGADGIITDFPQDFV
ncbi:MAG: hypothetical protein MI892_13625, partial [Desulfobacterales bacterium]|nr:hypothetical protein [Desulfobacterales bacterium]